MKVIDLTHEIDENMPVYPGTQKPSLRISNTYETHGYKETLIIMVSHTGTHIDVPAHLFKNGKKLSDFPIDQFIGKAIVIDCKHLKSGQSIGMREFKKYEQYLDEVDFILFNLGWDKKWGTCEYFGDYPVLDEAAIDLIIAGDYKGIGFDVIGLDPIADEELTRHKRIFANRDMINIENLKNLHMCKDKPFNFSCFPLNLKDGDGAPVRAVAWF